ncbi:MAG: ribbon-helix-helix protein, CopG family [Candidatus Portnoybacteria bacterium]|nr:ribbon-helix-helix protein, CopG family [Candidatus Portnoybacteria bacterium]
MKNIIRNTQVISISLPRGIAAKLESARKARGQSRSAFIASLVNRQTEEERWQRIYKRGQETAFRFGITSEEDIDRILHEN